MRALLALVAAGAIGASLGTRTSPAMAQDATAQDTIPPAVLAEGKAIFEGKRGALCVTCHAKNGKGITGLGPDLTDDKWLHADGSLKAIADVIRTGILKPKQSASVMPPMGGAKLNDTQVQALAAYVQTLSAKSR